MTCLKLITGLYCCYALMEPLAHATMYVHEDKIKPRTLQLVIFDRAGFIYHGRIKPLADGAREAGLQF